MSNILPIATMDESNVEKRLITLRGESVLIDADVARLYGVEVKRVNEAVRRNLDKFPQGYFFDLTKEETDSLRSQFVTLDDSLRSQFATLKPGNARGKHSKHGYKAFTEKGLYMLATILKSERATAATGSPYQAEGITTL